MFEHPADADRTDFPDPAHTDAAPPRRAFADLVEYLAGGRLPHSGEKLTVCVSRSGDGYTLYPDEKGASAAARVYPAGLMFDPTVQKGVHEDSPWEVRSGLEDGVFEHIGDDNWGNVFRAKAPRGPEVTPEQVDAVWASMVVASQSSGAKKMRVLKRGTSGSRR